MSDFIKVAKTSALAPGQKMLVDYQGTPVGLFNLGARFDVRTGAVRSLPAYRPVPTYRVKVEGEDILIAPNN